MPAILPVFPYPGDVLEPFRVYSIDTYHDDGADGMGEEQDGEGDGQGQAAAVNVPAGLIGGHGDGRADERHEAHHDEGEELSDGVEDAEHHEVHQETRVLGGWTVLSCSEDRKLRQIFRNKQALRRSLLTCDVSNSDNMRTLLCSVMGNKGKNTHNTKSQNYVICLNEEGYTEITLTDLQLM